MEDVLDKYAFDFEKMINRRTILTVLIPHAPETRYSFRSDRFSTRVSTTTGFLLL